MTQFWETDDCHGCAVLEREVDKQSLEIRKLQAEVERLRGLVNEVQIYLSDQKKHWDGLNADRYWQTNRILESFKDTMLELEQELEDET